MKYQTIKCPKCGKEYLLSEIYIPDSFFGKPTKIVRDENNKIIFVEGTDPDLEETFECDCGCTFSIKAEVSCCVEDVSDDTFEEEFSIKL